MADADLFYLSSGGQISGQLLNTSQNPRTVYDVKTDDGTRLALPASQVRKFEPTSDARRHYERFLVGMPDSAEGNWKMAQWCQTKGLTDEREHHLGEAVRLDPEHRESRLALGYTSLDGKWIKTDEWNRRRGYVYHQGSWMTPQEVEALTLSQKLAERQRSFKPRLKTLRSIIVRNRDRDGIAAAVTEIRAMKDPLAGQALAEMYEDEDASNLRLRSQLKLLWVQVLGENTSGAAVNAIVKAAIEDDDKAVREAARDALEASKDLRAVGALLADLKSKDNARVNRAGAALGRISDPETFLPLVDALVTEHKFILTQGTPGSTSATFSPNGGGGGLSAGNKTKVITRRVQNSSVLSALATLMEEHHVNFQYDQQGWKAWYAEKNTPDEVTLRRDP